MKAIAVKRPEGLVRAAEECGQAARDVLEMRSLNGSSQLDSIDTLSGLLVAVPFARHLGIPINVSIHTKTPNQLALDLLDSNGLLSKSFQDHMSLSTSDVQCCATLLC